MATSIKLNDDNYWDTSGIRGGQIFNFYGQLSGNSSLDITISSSWRGIIYAFRGSTIMGQYMVNCNTSGAVNVCEIATVTNITLTASTNQLTLTNAASASSQIYYIGSNLLS